MQRRKGEEEVVVVVGEWRKCRVIGTKKKMRRWNERVNEEEKETGKEQERRREKKKMTEKKGLRK